MPDLSTQTMSLVTQRMSELIAAVNKSTADHRNDVRQLHTELQSQRDDMVNCLHAVEMESSSNRHQVPSNDASTREGSAPGP